MLSRLLSFVECLFQVLNEHPHSARNMLTCRKHRSDGKLLGYRICQCDKGQGAFGKFVSDVPVCQHRQAQVLLARRAHRLDAVG